MKKILLPMLALALAASCSKSESGTPGTPDGRTLITLGAGVELATKAPIIKGSSVNAGIAGWENTSTENYSGNPEWNTGISFTVNNESAPTVSWTTPEYYNADDATKTYMKAWNPAGTLTGTAVTFANADGTVDALLAPVISGSKGTPATQLAFAHKTTQLKFKVVAGTGLAAGTKIKKITLKSVQVPTGFDLTKALTDADAVTWATAADLDIPNLTEAEIETDAAEAGKAVMFKPWADNTGANSLKIDVETSGATYTAKTFTTDGNTLAESSAYEVTLTFGQAGIGLKATIAEWTPANGQGTIE